MVTVTVLGPLFVMDTNDLDVVVKGKLANDMEIGRVVDSVESRLRLQRVINV